MRVTLEIVSGPEAGRRAVLGPGRSLEVGRAGTGLLIEHDSACSSRHFKLGCDEGMCHIRDLRSSNGTFLNGRRITSAVLHDGDRIKAGATTFAVRIEHGETPAASPAAWSFAVVPDGWEIVEGNGVRRTGEGIFASNVVVTEDALAEGTSLQHYVDRQAEALASHIEGLEVRPAEAKPIEGAEEVLGLVLRFPSDDGRPVLQHQLYSRRGRHVGVATLTTLTTERGGVSRDFDRIVAGLRFNPPIPRPSADASADPKI